MDGRTDGRMDGWILNYLQLMNFNILRIINCIYIEIVIINMKIEVLRLVYVAEANFMKEEPCSSTISIIIIQFEDKLETKLLQFQLSVQEH
jgi:hypothetical protein